MPRLPDGRYDAGPAAVASLIEFTYQGATYTDWRQLPPGQPQWAAKRRYDALVPALQGAIQAANTQNTPATQQVFRLDYNQLLNLSDRIRVLYWHASGGSSPAE